MRIRFWRHRPEASPRVPRQWTPQNERPGWASQPTDVYPVDGPGRAGNLTPAQRWRAGGWRRNGGSR
ncbi:hypothetical protein ONA70_05035 [Micromonospora yasonensis]|uniref:hypothetical protein n=1 Tax=Micromonospora yasonensis TaxID=1128667 RepID=UPI00222EA18A|nr:hypothetical protein [Micromonospora yasonensis]MCW3839461.1 hypothetical protein [Micromonospora yasonensis]